MNQARILSDRFPRMTDREISIALLIAEGLSNAEIAARISAEGTPIVERTVKNNNGPIALKMGVPPGGSSRVRIALCVHQVGPWAS